MRATAPLCLPYPLRRLAANNESQMVEVVWEHEAWSDWWEQIEQSYDDRWALTNWPIIHEAGWYDM